MESVGADPEIIQHKMLAGRMCNAGVPLLELSAAFSHDPRTIQRWGAAMLSGDIEEMARVFAGLGDIQGQPRADPVCMSTLPACQRWGTANPAMPGRPCSPGR